MQLWDQRRNGPAAPETSGRCCSLDDLYDARSVAARLGIPYYVLNFQTDFEGAVVREFVEAYRNGRTPSPCVLCNSQMKFDHLMRVAAEVEAERVATGHYARIRYDAAADRHLLLRARDRNKDQSYFLFELDQQQLGRAMFPLGDMDKARVREIARSQGLKTADKPESQEICFVPDGDYAAFIERHFPAPASSAGCEGEIVDSSGRVLGEHKGIHRFTIGQRRGLGIAHAKPLYVIQIHTESNRVVVGPWEELARAGCRVIRPNWIAVPELSEPMRVSAKIRSRHVEGAATIVPETDGSVRVDFDTPQHAVCPGQACVFYQEDVVVGGGWIS
jgi:tRNA-specific 2-thiouridylase